VKNLFIFFSIAAVLFFVSQKKTEKRTPIINKSLVLNKTHDNISEELESLFKLTNLKKPSSLDEAITLTQEKWIRPRGKERWESGHYLNLNSKKNGEAFKIFKNSLLMTHDILPRENHYDCVLILGALAETMRSRFSYLVYLIKEGKIKTNRIVFLVGARPTYPDKEDKNKLLGNYSHNLPIRKDWAHSGELPKTETEAARLIVEQVDLDVRLKKIIDFVNTPMQQNKNGSLRRPVTADTINAWLQSKPQVKSVLSISSNPYCGYQHAVLTKLLPKDWKLETIGRAPGREESIEIYFDSLARWLYQYRTSL